MASRSLKSRPTQADRVAHREQQLIKKAGRDLRSNRMKWSYFVKSYVKPTLVKLGSLALIKSNATGPSVDGKKYSGNFK